MNTGDLVRPRRTQWLPREKWESLGFVVSVRTSIAGQEIYEVDWYFDKSADIHDNLPRWCNHKNIEVISESR